MVQIAGRDIGEALAVSEQTLRKRLHEKGLLASVDEKRETLTVRRSIGGSSKECPASFREAPSSQRFPTATRMPNEAGNCRVCYVGFHVGKSDQPDMNRPSSDQ